MNEKRKRVLIITYYWPPCGGIGVLRCLKIAKYLRQYGWEPVIYTADGAHYPSIDESNIKEIPEGVEVLRGKIWEPYHVYKYITGQKQDANVNNVFYASDKKLGMMHKLSVWIRSNFFIPDARAQWIGPSVKYLLQYLQQHPVDAMLSNGPPHSNTRIATLIRQKTGLPWLADFQDPWTQVDYFAMLRLTPWGLRKHMRMEQEAFAAADAISIVSPTWKKELESIGARDVEVIPWGYDATDFEGLQPLDHMQGFTITHTGLLGGDRTPAALLQALKELVTEMPDLQQELRLVLVGLVDVQVRKSIEDAGLATYTTYVGNVTRTEALRYLVSSQVLLLLLNQQPNARGRIPGKFFEYLAVKRPTLAFGPAQSDVQQILSTCQAGQYATFEDVASTRQLIQELYANYKAGKTFAPNEEAIGRFTNQKLTERVAAILNRISQPVHPA